MTEQNYPTVPFNTPTTGNAQVRVTVELIAYAGLMLVVALMLLLRLGIVPLTAAEVPRALAAWQAVQPTMPNTAQADMPLLQLAHMLVFSTLGHSEAVVRLPTALLGVLFIFSPILFRPLLGAGRAFVLCLLLSVSPVVIAGSRLDSPVIWQGSLTILSLWAVWRYTVSSERIYAVGGTVLVLSLALLAGSTGHVMALTIVLSLLLLSRFMPDFATTLKTYWESWDWLRGLGFGALAVIVISTLFMIYPDGFNAVAQGIGRGVMGWFERSPDSPLFYALLASLIYEPILWVFGVVAVLQVRRQDVPNPVDVFLLMWLIVSIGAALLYRGTLAENALWLTLPLIGLVSGVVMSLFEAEEGILWYNAGDRIANIFGMSVPVWVQGAITTVTAFLVSLIPLRA